MNVWRDSKFFHVACGAGLLCAGGEYSLPEFFNLKILRFKWFILTVSSALLLLWGGVGGVFWGPPTECWTNPSGVRLYFFNMESVHVPLFSPPKKSLAEAVKKGGCLWNGMYGPSAYVCYDCVF